MDSPSYPEAPDRRGSPSITAQAQHVVGRLAYLKPTSQRPYNYMYEPPNGAAWENCEYDLRAMRIVDARDQVHSLSVHTEGFELRDAPTAVTNFTDGETIVGRYYPEIEEIACAVTGAVRAFVFDHLIRKREPGRPPLRFGRYGDGSTPTASGRIHNDYTEESGRRRLAMVIKDPSVVSEVKRYSIVNVWRSIKGPILDTPLAVCDTRTVSAADLVSAEVRYQTRTGEIYLVTHSTQHHWCYFSAMDRHEALIFKQYDSQTEGTARYTPHAAFDLPDTPLDAPLRESIEVRCLVVYS